MQLYEIAIVCFPGGTFYEHCDVRCPWGPHPWFCLRPQQFWYLFNIYLVSFGMTQDCFPGLVFFIQTDTSLVLDVIFQLDVRPTCTFKLMTRLGWLERAPVTWQLWIFPYPSTWWCHQCLRPVTWVRPTVQLQVQYSTVHWTITYIENCYLRISHDARLIRAWRRMFPPDNQQFLMLEKQNRIKGTDNSLDKMLILHVVLCALLSTSNNTQYIPCFTYCGSYPVKCK